MRGRSDVDTVGMFLAQSLVFFGEERLTFQISGADRAHKAGVVPGKPKSLQELVPRFNGEVAAVAVGPKQVVVVLFTVWLSILHVKHVASDWLLAGDTDETGHVPGLFQGIHDLPQNLLLAAAAGGSEELLVATLAVHLAPLLHKPVLCQGGVAVSAVEFLGVPRHAHGHQERAPDDIVALVAHRGAGAGRDVLGPLHQGVEVLWMWLRGGAVSTSGSRVGNFAKRGSCSTLWKT